MHLLFRYMLFLITKIDNFSGWSNIRHRLGKPHVREVCEACEYLEVIHTEPYLRLFSNFPDFQVSLQLLIIFTMKLLKWYIVSSLIIRPKKNTRQIEIYLHGRLKIIRPELAKCHMVNLYYIAIYFIGITRYTIPPGCEKYVGFGESRNLSKLNTWRRCGTYGT